MPLRYNRFNTDEEAQATNAVDATSTENQGNNGCEPFLNILSCACLFLMSIFFIIGCSYFHPGTWLNLIENIDVFFTVGAFCYMIFLYNEIYKRGSKGKVEVAMISLAVVGAFLWLIAPFAPFFTTWMIGSLLVLMFITFDLIILIKGRALKKFPFTAIALSLAWFANILYLGGAMQYLNIYSFQDVYTYAGLYIAGSVLYFLHALFYTLAVYRSQ